jgi:urease accessory protein
MDSKGRALRVGSPEGLRYRDLGGAEGLRYGDPGSSRDGDGGSAGLQAWRDHRVAAAIGRDARLELVFERRRGRTIVAHAYAEPPYRLGQSFAIDDAAYVILVCSGPGVFGGDRLHQSIRVGPGARVVVTSQSALQVHPPSSVASGFSRTDDPYVASGFSRTDGRIGAATVRHEYHVADDGELHCHWDPVIPFADAALVQQFELALGPTARLYWSDALMSGRASRGEAWRFRTLAHTLQLRIGGALKYLERYRLSPADGSITRGWIAGACNYFATTLVHHPRATPDEVEALHRLVDGIHGARAAVDLLEPQLIVARVMAPHGPPFAAARAAIRGSILDTVFEKPALAGRK